MATTSRGRLTAMLRTVSGGDRQAMDELMEVVYDELRAVARHHLAQERGGHTLSATALVHEAYVRLIDQHQADWHDRAHFFGSASRIMRRILVDHARARRRVKRGGQWQRIALHGLAEPSGPDEIDVLGLDEALTRLHVRNPLQSRIVEMRFFAGLSLEEVAALTGIGRRTVDREWSYAKAWLYRELAGGGHERGIQPG